jgi:orotidine-5'-phosphate decarboxylase
VKAAGNPICVALDTPDIEHLERLAYLTEPHVGMFKVGIMAFSANGPSVVRGLVRMRPVFLDLKLNDIPAQVHGAVGAIADMGASFVTVHAAGGPEMLRAAVDAADGKVAVLAVTVLTSLDDRVLELTGIRDPTESQVLRLSEVALEGGAPGLVCSPLEIAAIRARFGARSEGGPLLVVPGIRRSDAPKDDQRRTMGPKEALDSGADVLVVGRPITASPDPAAAARMLAEEVGA